MALIKCPECGQDISDKVEICIHCGYPLPNYNKFNSAQGKSTDTIANGNNSNSVVTSKANGNGLTKIG